MVNSLAFHNLAAAARYLHSMYPFESACVVAKLRISLLLVKLLYLRRPMGYGSIAARTLAVYCWCVAAGVIGEALTAWNNSYIPEHHGTIKDPRAFIKYNGEKFLETGTTANRSHHPDTKIISDEQARLAARVLKGGYLTWRQPCNPNLPPELTHVYWTSIRKTCAECPLLKSIIKDYHVSPEYLLKRMHDVDPDLKYRSVDYKMDLLWEQKVARKLCALDLLHWLYTVPNFLARVVWIDEVSIWLVSKNINVHVYADAHDEGVKHVVHCAGLRPGTKIKVRCLCAVNYLIGPMFLDFTTGTTDLQRIWAHPEKPYWVSHGDLRQPDLPITCRSPGFRV